MCSLENSVFVIWFLVIYWSICDQYTEIHSEIEFQIHREYSEQDVCLDKWEDFPIFHTNSITICRCWIKCSWQNWKLIQNVTILHDNHYTIAYDLLKKYARVLVFVCVCEVEARNTGDAHSSINLQLSWSL